jgi:hypothetical protein
MAVDASRPAIDNHVFLLGRPSISEFVRFIKTRADDWQHADDETLALEWLQARDRIYELESTEGGWADNPKLIPLSADLCHVANNEIRNDAVRRALRYVPYRWSLVEIDRLVVSQKWINLRFVNDIKTALPRDLNERDLLQLAIGNPWQRPSVHLSKPTDNTYCFSSTSSDLRLLDVAALDPAHISGHQPPGHACNALAIFVGFGVNFVNAVHVRNRLVLANGSHRLYALRELGITHAPCAVAQVTRDEELELLFPPELRQHQDLYLRASRPPLFKDYFDDRLRKVVPTTRLNICVKVQLTFETTRIPSI